VRANGPFDASPRDLDGDNAVRMRGEEQVKRSGSTAEIECTPQAAVWARDTP